jgi:Flp pilus assembly protein TadG
MSRLRRCVGSRHTEGQTLVLFALMSLVLLAGLGLVIDAGVDYANRRVMQNAADLAALAGTRAISRQNTTQPQVKSVVESTAIANGVASASLVTCKYVNSSRTEIGNCDNHTNLSPIDSDVVGVEVKVSETHTTFVMRAIGIMNSGTAATSMAQVQPANISLITDALIAVCGVDTATTGGTTHSILETEQVLDTLDPNPNPSPSPSPLYMTAATFDAPIQSDAYSYDWNQRDSNTGTMTLLYAGAPEFIIQGSDIARCKKSSSWNGLINVPDNTTAVEMRSNAFDQAQQIDSKTGDLASGTGPYHTINGPNGCVRNQTMTGGCVILLPIIDNYRANLSDTTNIYVRAWGAFAVTQAGGEYYGRLIKNYPVHGDSTISWTPDYDGPITITLVKQN